MGLCRKILVIEPYFGGSHKFFLQELEAQLDLRFTFITLPARKWKWRMRFAAPWVAEQLATQLDVEAVLCSTFVDVATLRGLAPSWFNRLPILTYFHENQFAYPVQIEDERDFHFSLTNYLTALASDRLAFNSRFNLDTFLAGCRDMEKKAPDVKLCGTDAIAEKSIVLPFALDFSDLDQLESQEPCHDHVIVWNHRWEHDKNPDLFFHTLFELADENVPFRLIVVGQSFMYRPAIFAKAKKRLQERLVHFGYAKNRSEYLRLLKQGTIIISTASHEFYGLSVIEAVRAGCRPLLPKRLSYPELFGECFLYDNDHCLKERLKEVLATPSGPLILSRRQELTDRFSWTALRQTYEKWLTF
jgi:glycosyltransferase involved in cell wall biosynthesis